MATWIRVDVDLPDDPVTLRLADRLGCDTCEAYLLRLDIFTARFFADGDLAVAPATMIARACRWPGDPELFLGALIEAGALERDGDLLVVRGWSERQGKLAEAAAAARERARASRERLKADREQGVREAFAHDSRTVRPTDVRTYVRTNKQTNTEEGTIARAPAAAPPPKDGARKRSPFVPPTLLEVEAHVAEKAYSFSAARFHAYYEATGWRVGRAPMRDWVAACRTWQARERPAPPRTPPTHGPAGTAADAPIVAAERCPRCGGPNPQRLAYCKFCAVDLAMPADEIRELYDDDGPPPHSAPLNPSEVHQ